MKTLSLVMTGVLACGLAQARDERVEVQGHALSHLSTAEAQALQGRYVLADGRVLAVARQGRRLLADVDGAPEQRMLALSATRLQSADGRLTLDFDAAANGDVWRVTLTQAGQQAVASAPAGSSGARLAAR